MLRSLTFLAFVGYCCGRFCNDNLDTGHYIQVTLDITNRKHWILLTSNTGHYLQVEFRDVSILTAILTRRRIHFDQWVSLYKVKVSMDGVYWTYLLNPAGDVQVFPGNSEKDVLVTNELEGTVIAKYIRVISVDGYSYRSMRLEVKGCSVVCNACQRWEAKLGASGDVFSLLNVTDASNQGQCGLKCSRQTGCDIFWFVVTSARCILLNAAADLSHIRINMAGTWYFVKV